MSSGELASYPATMNTVVFQYLDTKRSQLKANINESKQISKLREKMATEDPTIKCEYPCLYMI